jgi:hypothetical protein
MRQLLLRVPDEVHRRLAARAARERRSVNALATDLLDLAADVDQGDRRSRLRARAASMGALRRVQGSPVGSAARKRIIESTRGLGPVADSLLDAERDRV